VVQGHACRTSQADISSQAAVTITKPHDSGGWSACCQQSCRCKHVKDTQRPKAECVAARCGLLLLSHPLAAWHRPCCLCTVWSNPSAWITAQPCTTQHLKVHTRIQLAALSHPHSMLHASHTQRHYQIRPTNMHTSNFISLAASSLLLLLLFKRAASCGHLLGQLWCPQRVPPHGWHR
jgi:hypothetical protein